MNTAFKKVLALIAIASVSLTHASESKTPSISDDIKIVLQVMQETMQEWKDSFNQFRKEAKQDLAPVIDAMKARVDAVIDHIKDADVPPVEQPEIASEETVKPKPAQVDIAIATEEITAVVLQEQPHGQLPLVSWIRNHPFKAGSIAALTLGGIYATYKLVSHLTTRQQAHTA